MEGRDSLFWSDRMKILSEEYIKRLEIELKNIKSFKPNTTIENLSDRKRLKFLHMDVKKNICARFIRNQINGGAQRQGERTLGN